MLHYYVDVAVYKQSLVYVAVCGHRIVGIVV